MLQFNTIENVEKSLKKLKRLSKISNFEINKRIRYNDGSLKNTVYKELERQFNKKLRTSPKSRDRRNFIGLEFELISKKEKADIYMKSFELKLDGKIKIKGDSSINCRYGYKGREITILTTKHSLLKDLKKLDKLFKWMKAEVNTSCGLHVHIDTRNRNRSNVINNFLKLELLIAKLVEKKRLRNRFCRITKYRTSTNYSWSRDRYVTYTPMDDKYQAINTNPRNTVEIRLHEGCLDMEKVYAWAMLLNKIADHNSKLHNEIKNKNQFKNIIKLNPKINKYIETTYQERAL